VGEFVVPWDFIVVDRDESSHVPIILGRPFLATVGAKIDVQAGTISSRMCGEMVDFCLPTHIPSSVLVTYPPPAAPMPVVPPDAVSTIEVFDGDGGPHMWPTVMEDIPPPIPTSLGTTSV